MLSKSEFHEAVKQGYLVSNDEADVLEYRQYCEKAFRPCVVAGNGTVDVSYEATGRAQLSNDWLDLEVSSLSKLAGVNLTLAPRFRGYRIGGIPVEKFSQVAEMTVFGVNSVVGVY